MVELFMNLHIQFRVHSSKPNQWMSLYDNIVLLNASNTLLNYSFTSKVLSQNTFLNTISVRKITEFCFFIDIIFDVTRYTLYTEDKFGNALE